MPRQLHPTAIQVAYFKQLKAICDYARQLVKERLISKLPEFLARAADQHGDAHTDAQHPSKRVGTIIDGIARTLAKKYDPGALEKIGKQIGTRTADFQKVELNKQIKSALGVDVDLVIDRKLSPKVNRFVAENASLITKANETYLQQVETVTMQGIRDGARASDLEADLLERGEVNESRAKVIARDQVSKFYGELNQARQEDLGVDKYIWRTVEDNRVRTAHDEFDGEVFTWEEGAGQEAADDPGIGRNPGDGIQCRCQAEPYLEDILNPD